MVTNVAGFINSMGAAAQSLAQTKAAGVALAAAFGGAVIAAVSEATQEFRDFQSDLRRVQRQTSIGLGRKVLSDLEDMSTRIPVARKELADLAVEFGRAGVQGRGNLRDMTKTAAQFAEVTDVSFGSAANDIVKLLGLLDKSPSKTREMLSAINLLGKSTVASASKIVDSLRRSSASLRILGLETDQILSLNAALQKVGVSANTVGTALRSTSQQLIRPSRVEEVADVLGRSTEEFQKMAENAPVKLLFEIGNEMASASDRGRELTDVFTRAARRVLPKLADIQGKYNDIVGKTSEELKEAGELSKDFQLSIDQTRKKVQKTKNQITELESRVGEGLNPAFLEFLKIKSDILKGIDSIMDNFGGLETAIAGLAISAGILVGSIAALLSGGFVPMISVILGSGGILAAVTRLTGAFSSSSEEAKSYSKALDNATKSGRSFSKVFNSIESEADSLNEKMIKSSKIIRDQFVEATIDARSKLKMLDGNIGNLRKEIFDAVSESDEFTIFSNAGKRTDELINKLKSLRDEQKSILDIGKDLKSIPGFEDAIERSDKLRRRIAALSEEKIGDNFFKAAEQLRKATVKTEEWKKKIEQLPEDQAQRVRDRFSEINQELSNSAQEAQSLAKGLQSMKDPEKIMSRLNSIISKVGISTQKANAKGKRLRKNMKEITKVSKSATKQLNQFASSLTGGATTMDIVIEKLSGFPRTTVLERSFSNLESKFKQAFKDAPDESIPKLNQLRSELVSTAIDAQILNENLLDTSIGNELLKNKIKEVSGELKKFTKESKASKIQLTSLDKAAREASVSLSQPLSRSVSDVQSKMKRAFQDASKKSRKELRKINKDLINTINLARELSSGRIQPLSNAKAQELVRKEIKKANKQTKKLNKNVNKTGELGKKVGRTISSSLTGAFNNIITKSKSVAEALKSVFLDITSTIRNVLIKQGILAAIKAMDRFSGSGSKGSKTIQTASSIGQAVAGFFGDTPGVLSLDRDTPLAFSKGDFVVASKSIQGLKEQIARFEGARGAVSSRQSMSSDGGGSSGQTTVFQISQDIDVAPGVKQIVRSEIAKQGKRIAEKTSNEIKDKVQRGGEFSNKIRGGE